MSIVRIGHCACAFEKTHTHTHKTENHKVPFFMSRFICVRSVSGHTRFLWRALFRLAINISIRPCQAKTCPSMWKMRRFSSSYACAEYHLCIWSPFMQIVLSYDSVSGQWRLWLDCVESQANLGLRCSHMTEDTFSHGAAHFTSVSKYLLIIAVGSKLGKQLLSDVILIADIWLEPTREKITFAPNEDSDQPVHNPIRLYTFRLKELTIQNGSGEDFRPAHSYK